MKNNLIFITIATIVLIVTLVTFAALNTNKAIEPRMKFAELMPYQSILGKIVFVTKGIYGGDLNYNCILKGKVRNITNRPYKDIFIIWSIWDANNKPIRLYSNRVDYSILVDKIDYLDVKSEADFQIYLDLYSDIDMDAAVQIKEAIKNGREETCIYILNEKKLKNLVKDLENSIDNPKKEKIKRYNSPREEEIGRYKGKLEALEKISNLTWVEIKELYGNPLEEIKYTGGHEFSLKFKIEGKEKVLFFNGTNDCTGWSK